MTNSTTFLLSSLLMLNIHLKLILSLLIFKYLIISYQIVLILYQIFKPFRLKAKKKTVGKKGNFGFLQSNILYKFTV